MENGAGFVDELGLRMMFPAVAGRFSASTGLAGAMPTVPSLFISSPNTDMNVGIGAANGRAVVCVGILGFPLVMRCPSGRNA
jgi:hypothetical protein